MAWAVSAGVAREASAQALGTMQVSARVIPGAPSWAGLTEARHAAESLLEDPSAERQVRHSGLVRTESQVQVVAGRRRLVVTVHLPRN